MYIIDEKDVEYHFGDSDEKYLMNGPRMSFTLIQFQSGQNFRAHYHKIMEEKFYILDGQIDIVVNGKMTHLVKGQFIHIEPGEIHYFVNNYNVPVKMVSTLAPYHEMDKIEI